MFCLYELLHSRPTSKKTVLGVDPSADATRQPVVVIEKSPTIESSFTPIVVRAAERVSGPEAETTTVNAYKYKREWTPLVIPIGVLQVVSTPFICLGAALDPSGGEKVLDSVVAGMNEKGCGPKGWFRTGTYFTVGIIPSCEVRASTVKKEKRLTSRTVFEDHPYENAVLRMVVAPYFGSKDGTQKGGADGLRRDVVLDKSGRAEINVAALFKEFTRQPDEVGIRFDLEGPAKASAVFKLDQGLCRSLFKPISEEREGARFEQAGDMPSALVHFSNAYAATSDKGHRAFLWKKIAGIYRAMNPKPPVPESSKRYMVRGRTAVAEAASPSDFEAAVREFMAASLEAPFWPEVHYNLGVLLEKMDRLDDAIESLQKYLDLAPDAEDAEQVKTMIYQIEYKMTRKGDWKQPDTRRRSKEMSR